LIIPVARFFTVSGGAALAGGKVYTYESGTVTPKASFTDFGAGTPNTNPVILDSAGEADIWLDGNYTINLTDSDDVQQANYPVDNVASVSSGGASEYVVTTGSANAYIATPAPAIVVYEPGTTLNVQINVTNTGASTIDVSGLGTKSLVLSPNIALAGGELLTDVIYQITYDGTNFQVIGVISSGVNAQTGTSYTVLTDDKGRFVTGSNASAIAWTLPQANSTTFANGWNFTASCIGAGAITITPTTSTIDGAATLVLPPNKTAKIVSDGTNYFVASNSSSGWELLSTQTASASSTIDFTSFIDSTYNNYVFVFDSVIPATDNALLYLRVSIASSFQSGATDYGWGNKVYDIGGGSVGQFTDASDSEIHLCGDTGANGVGNGTGESASGTITLPNPSSTAVDKLLYYKTVWESATGTPSNIDGVGYYLTSQAAVDGLQFFFSSGNIASGTFKMYGVN
jgi:hypothetical protein